MTYPDHPIAWITDLACRPHERDDERRESPRCRVAIEEYLLAEGIGDFLQLQKVGDQSAGRTAGAIPFAGCVNRRLKFLTEVPAGQRALATRLGFATAAVTLL